MKYYPTLAKKPSFTLNDAIAIIGSKESASKALNSMIRNGSVHRIRNNLYTCFNFNAGDDYASRFQIATRINEDSFIGFHSAFEFRGFYNQTFFEMQVCSSKKFSPFEYEGYRYKWFLSPSPIQIENIQNIRVTTIERTIVDSIRMLGKAIGMEELVQCLNLIHEVNEDKILEMLSIYNQERLYRKVGYVLSFYKSTLSLSEEFFNSCKAKGVLSNKGYLVNSDKENLVFDSTWGLYAYGNLKHLTSKGGEFDV